ncbi:MAG TPA: hypothetical protein VFI73_11110 [Candidatus Nitrosopolaris sp.]|nr:hypothetical protein [Candidatus Nitrosopolaris sp.]
MLPKLTREQPPEDVPENVPAGPEPEALPKFARLNSLQAGNQIY